MASAAGGGAAAVASNDPVAHLLRRLTFLATPADVAAARSMGQDKVIAAALTGQPYPGSDQGVQPGVVDPTGQPFYITYPKSGAPTHGVIGAAEAEAVEAARMAAGDPARAQTPQFRGRLAKFAVDDSVLPAALGAPAAMPGATAVTGASAAAAASALRSTPRTEVFDPAVDLVAAQMWWTDRMVRTAWPLQERMVLFWHNHFATANSKVDSPALMLRQNALFRRLALGNFRDLMQAVAVDAAMLIWLDGDTNRKQAPNENFGREFMELFTVGLGYTQADVEAAARAFTGWRVDFATDTVVFHPGNHDDGTKTFFGQTGRWTGADVIDIALRQPAHGPFLMGKLWQHFVGTAPTATDLAPVVRAYVGSGWNVAAGLAAILSSPGFVAPQALWALYRSPAEYVVAAMRAFGRPVQDAAPVAAMSALGQDLLNPPNVGGWPGGATWLNAGTLLGRFNFSQMLSASQPPASLQSWARTLRPGASASAIGPVVDAVVGQAGLHGVSAATQQALVAYAQAPETGRTPLQRASGLLHLVLGAPEFQLM